MDENQTFDQDRILKINIEEEMKSSYIDYSMSVIVARALPDVRDGFKPVHRRILYGMLGIGNTSNNPYKKCARVVGEVLGKYHPHGDSSVYGAIVRMGQDWNMRYTLVDGQGNFGSIDGDSAAAMRYTECRLSKMGEHVMDDLEKNTVDMTNNFDDTLQEPTVMPTKIPNLLVNGGNGIAVGMATNIPTHNLGEVVDGCCAYIDNPDIDTDGLMQYIKAPDFPTGAYIYGLQGVKDAYETGRGRIMLRAKSEIESDDSHDKIVVTELPYGVNKAQLVENIAELVKEGKIDGISNVNDESGRQGMRIVVDVKRDANANVILNKLYKMTAMQSSFSVNCIALVKGRPRLLSLKDCVRYFVEHRHDVTIRRTRFDLTKAEERAHIIKGLIIACDNVDEVVRIIRASKTPSDAQRNLEKRFDLDELQSKAIVDMRLSQLTGLRVEQLHAEYDELLRQISYLQSILDDPELCKKVMKDELLEVKEKYNDPRRTEIKPYEHEFNAEDFQKRGRVLLHLALGSLCMALVAGCRPQMVLFAVLALPILWPRYITEKRLCTRQGAEECAAFLLPVVLVAAGLMWYNAARFGSVFDFGANYNLTSNDMTRRGFAVGRIAPAVVTFLLGIPGVQTVFPYLSATKMQTNYMGLTITELYYGGAFACLPLLWGLGCLPLARRRLDCCRDLRAVFRLTAICTVVLAVLDCQMAGMLYRYQSDWLGPLLLAAALAWLLAERTLQGRGLPVLTKALRTVSYIRAIDPMDDYLSRAAAFGSGIRILNQDLWEMVITFIISQQKTIPAIRALVEALSEKYGTRHKIPPTVSGYYYAFPSPEELNRASLDDLLALKLGYRAKYIKRICEDACSGKLDLDRLRKLNYADSMEVLLSCYGIGVKVANCICLFGLHHIGAFPVDTWIKKILLREYAPKSHCTGHVPETRLCEALIEENFSKYPGFAGVLQQYIFFYERDFLRKALQDTSVIK